MKGNLVPSRVQCGFLLFLEEAKVCPKQARHVEHKHWSCDEIIVSKTQTNTAVNARTYSTTGYAAGGCKRIMSYPARIMFSSEFLWNCGTKWETETNILGTAENLVRQRTVQRQLLIQTRRATVSDFNFIMKLNRVKSPQSNFEMSNNLNLSSAILRKQLGLQQP